LKTRQKKNKKYEEKRLLKWGSMHWKDIRKKESKEWAFGTGRQEVEVAERERTKNREAGRWPEKEGKQNKKRRGK